MSWLTDGAYWAYIDPGSGSYLFQIAIAGFTALLFTLNSVRRRVAQWLHRRGRPEEEAAPPSPVPPQPTERPEP